MSSRILRPRSRALALAAGAALALSVAGTASAATASGDVNVTATIAPSISLAVSDGAVAFGDLLPNSTNTASTDVQTVKVTSNAGYDLSAKVNGAPAGWTLNMQAGAPSGATQTGFSGFTALTTSDQAVGGRASGGSTASTGEDWTATFQMVTGFLAANATYSQTVTFTAATN